MRIRKNTSMPPKYIDMRNIPTLSNDGDDEPINVTSYLDTIPDKVEGTSSFADADGMVSQVIILSIKDGHVIRRQEMSRNSGPRSRSSNYNEQPNPNNKEESEEDMQRDWAWMETWAMRTVTIAALIVLYFDLFVWR